MGPLGALPLETNFEDRIYRDLIAYSDNRILDDFEYLVNYSIPSILKGDYVVSSDLIRRVTDVKVMFPYMYKKINGEKVKCLLTPAIAKMTKQSYMCTIVCRIENINPIHNTIVSVNDAEIIGSIPNPIGSCRCVTSYKPNEIQSLDEWKMMCQEDPSIPGGYFIKDGAKKIFLHGEHMSTNTYFTIESHDKYRNAESSFTELYRAKTTLIRIHTGTKRSSVKILLPHLSFGKKPKHYPLFLVIYLLVFQISKVFDIDTYIKFISKFAPKHEQKYIVAYLETSKIIFETKFTTNNGNTIQISQKNILEYITRKIKSQVKHSKNNTKNNNIIITNEGISNKIQEEIARSVKTIAEKITNLCGMVCQHVRTALKLREYDNEDSWVNKKLDTPIRLIEQYVANYLTEKIKTKGGNDGAWLIGKGDREENIVESMKMDTVILTRFTYGKVNAKVNTKIKIFEVRAVSHTSYGTICPVKTSEGKKCGLTKAISICTKISNNSEHIENRLDIIFDLLTYHDYSSLNHDDDKYIIYISTTDIQKQITTTNGEPIYVSDKFCNAILSYNPEINFVKENNAVHIIIDNFKKGETSIRMWNNSIIKLSVNTVLLTTLAYGFQIINDALSLSMSPLYNFLFTYNGNFFVFNDVQLETLPIARLIWVNSDVIIPYLKKMRREGKLSIDCCIFKNTVNKIIQYYDDSGRLMAPYLTSDEDGNLMLDSFELKDQWNGLELINYNESNVRIKSLFDNGIIEYVDTKELNTVFIADTIQEFRHFANLRKFLNSINFEELPSYIFETDKNIFKNEDISYVQINNNNYDIEFITENNGGMNITLNNITLYGRIIIPFKLYTSVNEKILTILKPSVCQIRDGFYLATLENDELLWIQPGSVGINETLYNNKKIINIRFKPNSDKLVMILKNEVLIPNSYLYLKNEGFNYFIIKNDEIIWNDTLIYNESEICNKVDFNGLDEGFFNYIDDREYMPLEDWMDYEKFDINAEKTNYDNIVIKNEPNDRESSLIISYIRRDQNPLYILTETTDLMIIIDEFRKSYPSLTKKSNIYKMMRYLNWRFKFTHVPIDPNLIYSSTANLVPKANHSQSPRFTYQSAMATQALGLGYVMYPSLFETSIKKTIFQKQHLFETIAEEPLTNVTMSTREDKIVAVYNHRAGFEDALILSKSLFGRYEVISTITVIEKIDDVSNEFIGFPLDDKGNKKSGDKYRHLDENGIPRLGSIIKIGDCIVGQMSIETNGTYKDISTIAKEGDNGEVIQIRIMSTEENKKKRLVRIKISQRRFQQPGDKLALIPSQKGTISKFMNENDTLSENLRGHEYRIKEGNEENDEGEEGDENEEGGGEGEGKIENDDVANIMIQFIEDKQYIDDIKSGKIKYKIIDDDDMPKVRGGPNDGMTIHILFSPFSFPSRMTMGLNFELKTVKAALRLQKKVNGTSFHKLDDDYFSDILEQNGIDRNGGEYISHSDGEIMIDITTGKPFKCYIGLASVQVLKHHVWDKRSCRSSKGKRDPITHQPIKGRTVNGGQRFGEMEGDALKSHGASAMAQDRLMYSSDKYDSVWCTKCEMKSSDTDVTSGICRICNTPNSLIVMEHPRVFSVLCQYLNGIGLNFNMKFPKKKD